jgi:hypothetical protein
MNSIEKRVGFGMETFEKLELQKKVIEKDDPLEEHVVEPLFKKMRLDSNSKYEEESSNMNDVSRPYS